MKKIKYIKFEKTDDRGWIDIIYLFSSFRDFRF